MPRRASPRCRRCRTTQRSAAGRTTQGGPVALGKTRAAKSMRCAAPSMPADPFRRRQRSGFCMYIRRAALTGGGSFRRRTVRPRLRRGKRFLPAARPRSAGSIILPAIRLSIIRDPSASARRAQAMSKRAIERLLERYPSYSHDIACARESGRHRTVSLRADRRRAEKLGTADPADGVARAWRRRAPAYRRHHRPPGRQGACAAAGIRRARRDPEHSRAARPSGSGRCRPSGWRTWSRCCAIAASDACTCIICSAWTSTCGR